MQVEWALCHLGDGSVGTNTTGRGEGENSAIKRSPAIHSKARHVVLLRVETQRGKVRRQSRALEDERVARCAPAAATKHRAMRELLRARLRDVTLTRWGEQLLVGQMEVAARLEVRRLTECCAEGAVFGVSSHGLPVAGRDTSASLWKPGRRLRRVSLSTCGDNWRLKCDCPHGGR
jgi:hypothetical protein